jgi:hypothetical protein
MIVDRRTLDQIALSREEYRLAWERPNPRGRK